MKKDYRALWDKLVGPLMLAGFIGLLALWLWAEGWLPTQAFWPDIRDGIQGAKRAYWGFALLLFSFWIGRFWMSYNREKSAPRWLAIVFAVAGVGVAVWFLASYPRGENWTDRDKWNEFVRLGLITLPAALVGALQKPVDMPPE